MNNKKLKPLNMDKIKNRKSIFLTSKESLKDVISFSWSEEVLRGESKIVVVHNKKIY